MSAGWKLALLAVASFATCVRADVGDDFSNNLFSDLSPLLALFGERVTMQFMSQSMGWADNIILAMAPLGITTIIVSAIRVGGPSWLKALVGRARENLAVAEAELMSSTSNEVCELWNGNDVVRCMGSAPICEFICLVSKNIEENSPHSSGSQIKDLPSSSAAEVQDTPGSSGTKVPDKARPSSEVEIIDLEKALRNGYLTQPDASICQDLRESRASSTHLSEASIEGGKAKGLSSKTVIIHNKRDAAPNISLNCHNQIWAGELRFVAVFATLLQLAVLLYSGFATYYPTMKFLKDGRLVASYAFPCTAVGTVVLVFGLLTCTHVVESSTHEDRYRPMSGTAAQLVWLQHPKTVSDQVFDSYAIFTRNDRRVITTSSRVSKRKPSRVSKRKLSQVISNSATLVTKIVDRAKDRGNTSKTGTKVRVSDERDGDGDGTTEKQDLSIVLEVKTIFGSFVSLCGFIVQFVGLRGMHWSVSIVQLGAVLLMTVLRALVRRGLATPPRDKLLAPGFELEWFALTLMGPGVGPWRQSANTDKNIEVSRDWRVVTDGGSNVRPQGLKERKDENASSKANKVMLIRKELGQHASWPSVVSSEALSLARAIEITMDALVGSSLTGSWSWSLETHFDQSQDHSSVLFGLKRTKEGAWEASAPEIEAALSLWLFSVSEHEKEEPDQKEVKRASPASFLRNNDALLRAKASPHKTSLRVLGPDSRELRRDLEWWMPHESGRILRIQNTNQNLGHSETKGTFKELSVKNHRIVGCGSGSTSASRVPSEKSHFKSWPLSKLDFDTTVTDGQEGVAAETRSTTTLAAVSSVPLNLLYAQDMFTSFMRSVATTLKGTIEGGSNIWRDDPSNAKDWKSFSLRNDQLSKLAQDIQDTGLGGLDQIYLSLIPPLSAARKVPEIGAVIELVQDRAKEYERFQNWELAADAYSWLFDLAQTFPGDSATLAKALAMLVDFLRRISQTIQLREAQRYTRQDINILQKVGGDLEEKATRWLEEEHKMYARDIVPDLMALYREQGRRWRWYSRPQTESVSKPDQPTGYPAAFGFTSLHALHRSHRDPGLEIEAALGNRLSVNCKDIYDWTALHYAAASGHAEAILSLLEYEADLNSRDLLDWTPLHYASTGHDISTINTLLRAGAKLDSRGTDGLTPLHCAAMSGRVEATKALIEAGASLDIPDSSGNTPFHWAAYHGHEEVVKYLSENANRKLRDKNGRAALHLAAGSGREAVVLYLIRAYSGTNAKDRYGQTPLHFAAANGHEAVVKCLVGSSAEVDARDSYGQTPLHCAAANGHEAVVKCLVGSGAEVDARDSYGQTPLHCAAASGHEAVVKCLVGSGAEVDARDRFGETPLDLAVKSGRGPVIRFLAQRGECGNALCIASYEGRHDIVEILLERGANINALGQNYVTALQAAVLAEREETVIMLIKNGADINFQWVKQDVSQQDNALQTAIDRGNLRIAELLLDRGAQTDTHIGCFGNLLSTASYSGRAHCVRLLLEKGANVNAKDGKYGNALQVASFFGRVDIVRMLLDWGADVNIDGGEYGYTLQAASSSGSEAIVRMLLEKGADVNAQGGHYGNALQAASWLGRVSVVKILLENGANVNAQGGEHGSALQAASPQQDLQHLPEHKEILKILLDNGAVAKEG